MYNEVSSEIIRLKNDEKKKIYQRFFKTGKGQYGEGDIFLGLTVPMQQKIAKKYYKEISLEDTIKLLQSKYHEFRSTALFILRLKYEKSNNEIQKQIYDLYLDNTKYINNWDLVDSSAPYITGPFIFNNNIDREILYNLINSNDLWEQRIGVMSTYYFIKQGDYKDTLKISKLLFVRINHMMT
jgi:3-methyladenine DNA glycosylase AlkD